MVYKVSTSEVATFLTCSQRWMYAHHPSYNLEPRTLGIALSRGLVGHKALEIYYQSIFDGNTEEQSRSSVQDYIIKESLKAMQMSDSEKALMTSSLGVLLNIYFDEAMPLLSKYNILGVEHLVTASLTEEIYFAGRVDLALEEKTGPYKGYVVPYDHKFTYNFWPEMAIKMNAQISNYIWVYNELGYRSRRGMLNMLRHRENAQQKFDQFEVPTNTELRKTFIRNHVVAATRIVELKKKSKVGIPEGITRSTSKFNCEYCPFVNLCYTEANGQDSTNMVKAQFRPNSYGYDSVLDIE